MAIALDASSQGSSNNTSSLTISHTVGSGANRVLYVFVASDDATDDLAGATVTYGGTSLGSPIAVVPIGGSATNWMYLWRMIAPPSGTANIVISAGTNMYLQSINSSWTDVDQTTPNGTVATAATPGASSPSSLSATASAGGVVLDFLHRRQVASSLTPDASQTRVGTEVSAVVGTSGSSYKAGSGSVAMVWTHASGGGISTTHMAVPLNEASGGGGGYSLTCDQGAYTLTGQAAGTLAGRKLAAAQGTYTLTGSTANLIEGHVLTCAQGSYTLTGSTAYADYAITCASGSYTLSGQVVGTKAARKMAAAHGSYTLTGQDVALLYTTPGAYSIAMGQGSYALTGQSAALQAARRIVAEQGLYALSGQAAALRIARQMALAAGSYTLTGQAAAFDAPAILTAAYGSYALTGQAVTLTYGGTPAPTVLSAPPSGRRLQGYGRPANIQRSTR